MNMVRVVEVYVKTRQTAFYHAYRGCTFGAVAEPRRGRRTLDGSGGRPAEQTQQSLFGTGNVFTDQLPTHARGAYARGNPVVVSGPVRDLDWVHSGM